ncbi:hypothetical protein [Phytohabitans suffuscus]
MFDDPALVSLAGLEPGMWLAEPCDLHGIVRERLHSLTDKESQRASAGRRGRTSQASSEVPHRISITKSPQEHSARDELHTLFGLYLLPHELTARSRAMVGGNRLLVGRYWTGTAAGRGLRALRGRSGLVNNTVPPRPSWL